MIHTESTAYGVVLFLALVVLVRWKRRHDAVARMKRGLSSYVADKKEIETQA